MNAIHTLLFFLIYAHTGTQLRLVGRWFPFSGLTCAGNVLFPELAFQKWALLYSPPLIDVGVYVLFPSHLVQDPRSAAFSAFTATLRVIPRQTTVPTHLTVSAYERLECLSKMQVQ